MSNNKSYASKVFSYFVASIPVLVFSILWVIYENTSDKIKQSCDAQIVSKIYTSADSYTEKYPTYNFNVIMKCQGYSPFNRVINVNEDLPIGKSVKYIQTIDLGKKDYAKESIWVFIASLLTTIILAIYSAVLLSGQSERD